MLERFGSSGKFVERGFFNRSNEAVAVAGDGFDEPRIFRGVTESLAETHDGGIETVIEVNKGVARPETFAKVFAGDEIAGSFEKDRENLPRLVLEANAGAVLTEFAGS